METFIATTLFLSLFTSTSSIFAGQNFENIPAPYFVRINIVTQATPALFIAGGTLISDQHVLCAGSTLQPANRVLNVHVGGNRRAIQRVLDVNRTVQHPQYNHSPRNNDIGIIFLSQPLRFDAVVRPIALPHVESSGLLNDNIQGLILGFGGTATNNQQQGSELLEGAFVRISNNTYCSSLHPNVPMNASFCAEDSRQRSDFCQQDIGGGFTVLQRGIEVVVGIGSIPTCIQSTTVINLPSLYTRVVPFISWIRQTTGV